MKKLLIIITLLSVITACFTGCTDSKNESDSESSVVSSDSSESSKAESSENINSSETEQTENVIYNTVYANSEKEYSTYLTDPTDLKAKNFKPQIIDREYFENIADDDKNSVYFVGIATTNYVFWQGTDEFEEYYEVAEYINKMYSELPDLLAEKGFKSDKTVTDKWSVSPFSISGISFKYAGYMSREDILALDINCPVHIFHLPEDINEMKSIKIKMKYEHVGDLPGYIECEDLA